MSIKNPSGTVCMSSTPIQRAHFQLSFQSPSGSFGDSENLEILTFPSLSQIIEARDFVAFNSQIPYAGIKQKIVETAKFRFFDNTKGISFWTDWFKKVYDLESDKVGIISEYAGTGEVTIFKAAGSAEDDMTEWGKIKITDCWPSSVGADELDMSSDEPLSYSVTLQITDAVFELS